MQRSKYQAYTRELFQLNGRSVGVIARQNGDRVAKDTDAKTPANGLLIFRDKNGVEPTTIIGE